MPESESGIIQPDVFKAERYLQEEEEELTDPTESLCSLVTHFGSLDIFR